MLYMRASGAVGRIRGLSAAVALVSLLSIGSAGAATLSIQGGTNGFLPASFNPTNIAAMIADGINVGTAIKIFDSSTTSAQGLFASPQNVYLTFEFMGFEAGYTNVAAATLNYLGTPLFINQTTAPGTTSAPQAFNVGSNPGLVPFMFQAVTPGNLNAYNGGPIAAGLEIAFAEVSSTVYYAFFDDGGAGPDKDYDDMVVKITLTNERGVPLQPTPLPAALPLFATGLGALGLLGWRRKRKNGAARFAA